MPIFHKNVWLVQGFNGKWDVIKACGLVLASDLSATDAYIMAEKVGS